MSDKQELIKQMIEMQKKFMNYEHEHGVTQQEYFTADESHELGDYRHQYDELAVKLIDMAHEEKGSHR